MKRLVFKLLFLTFILLAFTPNGYAQELTGNILANKVFNVDNGIDRFIKTDMVLVDKNGSERKRTLEIYSKDRGELSKTFLEFMSPADIKNTRFLSIEVAGNDDIQYLYLPALGRSRRIVSSQKNIRFANTDYTYEDMQRRRPEKDAHKITGQEQYNGYECYVLESVPNEKNSQYSKRVSWIDKKSFIAVRIDLYDKKSKKVKEFLVKDLKQIQGFWTATQTVMNDLKADHRTDMQIVEIKYDQNMDDTMFSTRHLEE
ncbi:MAG: outer membrane lipoprotein-sorting protein [Candidatus Omnitrophica bacterium]|nr:outer membrane lipoprotein-sorting protein [Candidatus Omnitrophota bacterium]MBU1995992.1 outer membrane lipoprotein-sorting protein [Candidatus Omnitrophota bacterium]MBU4334372.1 outer membrane lipoprotein-sorting protein [Candidatus Omnitrophota bacterium]